MAAGLDGVRRKLVGARSKLDALKTDVGAYMDPPPFQIAPVADGTLLTAIAPGRSSCQP
jgi:hypothetical protein